MPDRFLEAGATIVLAHVEQRGRGSGGGRVDVVVITIWLRAGRVLRLETSRTVLKALEAVGLSEQDAHADS